MNAATPTVSIIIPTYNRSDYLREALDSAIAQRPAPLEIIVVDDGSTDDTADVVRRDYPSVKYIHQQNQKQAAARETGRQSASGEFLLFLDSDDKLAEGAVSKLTGALGANPASPVAYGAAAGFSAGGPRDLYPLPSPEPGGETLLLARANFIQTPGCALIRKSALDRAGAWNTTVHTIEDWEMFLRLSLQGSFVRLPDVVLNYRVHGDNSSSNKAVATASYGRLVLIHSTRSSPVRANRAAWNYLRRGRHYALNAYLEDVARKGNPPPFWTHLSWRIQRRVLNILYGIKRIISPK